MKRQQHGQTKLQQKRQSQRHLQQRRAGTALRGGAIGTFYFCNCLQAFVHTANWYADGPEKGNWRFDSQKHDRSEGHSPAEGSEVLREVQAHACAREWGASIGTDTAVTIRWAEYEEAGGKEVRALVSASDDAALHFNSIESGSWALELQKEWDWQGLGKVVVRGSDISECHYQ
jgi:hypothetical protein